MKMFMAFWSVIRRFRDLLSYGLLTLIPFLNLIATWSYVGNNVNHGKELKDQMTKNIGLGYSAFDGKTGQIWFNWASTVIVSLSLTAISVYINNYAYATFPQSFDTNWMESLNVLHWLEIAAWCITGFFISTSIVAKINTIYTVHREWDPRFMDNPDAEYVKKHAALVEANRKTAEKLARTAKAEKVARKAKEAKATRDSNDFNDSCHSSDSDGGDD
jgi:hypothetical protein